MEAWYVNVVSFLVSAAEIVVLRATCFRSYPWCDSRMRQCPLDFYPMGRIAKEPPLSSVVVQRLYYQYSIPIFMGAF